MFKSQTKRLLPAIAAGLLMIACATVKEGAPVACPVCTVCPAPQAPVAVQPPAEPMQAAKWSDLPGWGDDDLTAAWPAFLQSCRALQNNGRRLLWRATCEKAKSLRPVDNLTLRRFFESRLSPYLLTNPEGTTEGTITGYYEPLLHGSKTRSARYSQPVLGVPDDLLTIDLGEVVPDVKNLRLRGRLEGRKIIPYYSRAEIVADKKKYADRVLLWVDDPVELFFLQIQGSGRVRLPDGKLVRIGYADQNGYPYQSIGRVLIDRGDLTLAQASMQGIQAWARAHPDKLNDLLNENPSYVFFREMPDDGKADAGPFGALSVPLTAGRSIAVDPRNVPLGVPVYLSATQPGSEAPLRRLMLAQDTGGAIRGVVRADFFWGFGTDAGALAGRMKQQGRMWVLLPPGMAPK